MPTRKNRARRAAPTPDTDFGGFEPAQTFDGRARTRGGDTQAKGLDQPKPELVIRYPTN